VLARGNHLVDEGHPTVMSLYEPGRALQEPARPAR